MNDQDVSAEEVKKDKAEIEKERKKREEQINKKLQKYKERISELETKISESKTSEEEETLRTKLEKVVSDYQEFVAANIKKTDKEEGGGGSGEGGSSGEGGGSSGGEGGEGGESGGEGGENPDGEGKQEEEILEYYTDEAFSVSFTQVNGLDSTSSKYLKNLESGLDIKSLRGIMGMPSQLLPSADYRLTTGGFGITYAEKIIKNIPLLLITPGTPSFMSSFSDKDRATVLTSMFGGDEYSLNKLLENGSGKYYTLKYAYVDYFGYVNTMLRSAAGFLGIGHINVDGARLDSKNWLYNNTTGDTDIFGREGLKKFLGPYAGCIAFYCNGGTDVSDSFSNATVQSQLASQMNGLSDTGRELNFLLGSIGSNTGLGDKLTKFTGAEELQQRIDDVNNTIGGMGLGKNNIFTNIINKAQTLLAGGKLIFPEIWSDSSFGRSYSCSMKLVAPSGDKVTIFLKILVPIYHLIALTLPRQSDGQAYFAPFLVRAYYKGLFNVDMGIITDLSVTKGSEGEWTLDGIPTVAEISFTIKDLYEGLAMTNDSSLLGGLFANVAEMDYIATSCGINVNDHDIARQAKVFLSLKLNGSIADKVTSGIFGNIAQHFNQRLSNLFGTF